MDTTNKLHLNVIHETFGRDDLNPSSASKLASGARNDFRWNDDYTAFRIVPLRWWDDASYARYQAGDDEE